MSAHTLPGKPKKSLGQHFLTNKRVVKNMVTAGDVQKEDRVLEIGPGTGVLTEALLAAGARVTAIEADARAITVLEKQFAQEIKDGALVLHYADIRTFDVASLGLADHEYKLIANIPYYLSGMLFELFLESDLQPSMLVFLVQKEVAERIARSEKESLLSLSIKAYGTPAYVQTVKKGNFSPPPAVDSAVLSVSDISRERFATLSEQWFFEVLHAGFRSKRKQLAGNILANLPDIVSKEELHDIFSTLGIAHTARGEDLSIDMWISLAIKLQKYVKQ